jgi:MerR family mercuric resistance operon transcriptional regulator
LPVVVTAGHGSEFVRENRKMMIGEMSKETGCNIETIRYYEKIGILPRPPRTVGNLRDYDQGHLKRLYFIRRSRELGFSLNEIRQMLSLVDGGNVTCEQVRKMALEHLAAIQEKISDLKRMGRILEDTAAKCIGGKTPECPIIDVLFDV